MRRAWEGWQARRLSSLTFLLQKIEEAFDAKANRSLRTSVADPIYSQGIFEDFEQLFQRDLDPALGNGHAKFLDLLTEAAHAVPLMKSWKRLIAPFRVGLTLTAR